jgi:hypothetical protein
MGAKQQLYIDFLQKEGYVPEVQETGDIRFKIQGEIFVVSPAEDDPHYFKLSYYHKWDPTQTEQVWPMLNALNAKFKVVKVSALNDVICLTTETFLKEPGDFESLFARCVNMIGVAKAQLSAALAQRAMQTAQATQASEAEATAAK